MLALDTVSIVLLDMNSTFMFGEDRFSATEDYYLTYQSVGGNRLGANEVHEAIQRCYEGLSLDYEDPEKFDHFPSLRDGFRAYTNIDELDLPHLVDTFACHELGEIPDTYARCLKKLACTHSLGLVANIWAPKEKWLGEFDRTGINDVFNTMVFSSELGCIKPSRRIYTKALENTRVSPSDVLFVGDSLKYDVTGAKNMGFNTVWITKQHTSHPLADYVIPDLLQLLELPA
jgi:FMN phosphatase YigB (HAD superfamily)